MKKIVLVLFGLTLSLNAHASDYYVEQNITQNVTQINQKVVRTVRPRPIKVYRGTKVTVQDYYDVYEPKTIYTKTGSCVETKSYNM